ncbi:RHS repeat-associated core domain-containing protein [Glycomyces harbinensis]|uniref:RHS repeat-associated core domain-containing protein n=1 Tax=Glycomyces harbinensis TaxID=58114 RepID=A0A1G6RT85_9ACTN|nr:SpvB/TcaC N-terminal domain-containing protein [Glycomyces harbinensis]SDD07166.1 RHS repeat-associated core domain-containing protein [Glycomyces harbinensis]
MVEQWGGADADRNSAGFNRSAFTNGSSGSNAAPGATAAPALPTAGNPPARLGETFQTNPVTGSAALSIPLPFSGGRGAPSLAVTYDSSGRSGLFGYGWDLPVPRISRRTDRGVPRYRDAEASDVFLAGGGEDLVPLDADPVVRTVAGVAYRVECYRPRIDDGDTRIERWTSTADRADCKWRTLSGDNATAWFGETPASRIADPADPTRIFAWLLSFSHDDKGNAASYEYAAEDSVGIDPGAACEANRTDLARTAGRHLKRVRHGNAAPYYPVLDPEAPPVPRPESWLFTLVVDYGDHDPAAPGLEPDRPWTARPDPYADCRPGFEVRTHRRGERALMFHDLPELGEEPTLVRSVEFTYAQAAHSGDSQLTAARTCGHARQGDGYLRAETPPLTLHYAPAELDPTVRDVRAEHLPAGLDLTDHTWVDLDGDGVAGVLASHRGAWYYMRNRSPLLHGDPDGVAFGPAEPVSPRPDTARTTIGTDLLVDLAGKGMPDLVRLHAPVPGFAGRDEDGAWRALAPFERFPNVDARAARVLLADLTGDGLADLVLADAAGERWCEGLGLEGFGEPRPLDAPAFPGPVLLDASATAAVQLADMTGDGLPDLVRIANGAVAYRPNLGHGRFGPAVAMDHAPRFDGPDLFDPRRVLLADLDGNGRTDLAYLAADGVRLYANRSGNAWDATRLLPGVPGGDNRRYASVVDLRGTGTACLVWSTGLPHGTAAAMRYIDLFAAGRPHLLTSHENGTGGEVRVEYKPSTFFALADEQAGRPWPSRLPFPVSCAHRVIRTDHIRATVFTDTTSYHDGYFDPVEREFRGFGRVETIDTEAYAVLPEGANTADADLHQPPVLTRTWFHTGAAAGAGERMLHARRDQYWENPAVPEAALPEPGTPAGLSDEEYRQACRALKGVTLRTEVYGLDETPESALPYSVSESAYDVVLRQPLGDRRHAVFQLLPTEAVSYAYDRRPEDPRVSHSLVLETDDLGLPLRTAAVAYGRAVVDLELPQVIRDAQARPRGGYSETEYTADVLGPDTRRLRQVCETRSYELAGLPAGHLSRSEVDAIVAAADRAPYETVDEDGTVPTPDGPVLRLIGRTQSFFRSDDLATALPLGVHESLGLGHHGRGLVLTDGLVAGYYDGSVSDAELLAAGYQHFDQGWWAPSGTVLYASDAADHFYLPAGAADPLGVTATIARDAHDLMVVLAVDALGREVRIEPDYRLLAPRAVTDPAGVRAEAAFDVLGATVATALVGRPGEPDMDTLDDPTAETDYDLFAWINDGLPVWTRTRRRERHGPSNTAWQETYAYFDGGGAPVMNKSRVAPGPAKVWDPDTDTVSEVEADPRWVGNGRTVFNNKGLPVKQYQPYFSTTHGYESEAALVETGVTAVPRYDPLGRVFRVDYPDGTLARTETGPWKSVAHDPGDTVLDSAWYAERGSPDPLGPEPADPQERAAWLTAQHAETPTALHTDVLGRTVLTVADNGGGDLRFSRGESDASGGFAREFDTRGRVIGAGVADLSGRAVRGDSAERGRRWSLTDIVGRLVRTWDEYGRSFRVAYDAVHRPVATYGTEPGETETMLSRVVYGDAHPEAAERNLTGRTHMVFDSGGAVSFDRYDHQGNPLRVLRRFCADWTADPDWSILDGIEDPELVMAAAAPLLEPLADQVETGGAFDALGRATTAVLADGTVITPAYDEANRLAELGARLGGTGPVATFMAGQEYDALGRRTVARYGNGLTTDYTYDPLNLKVTEIRTAAEGSPDAAQHLHYAYEAAGHLAEAEDTAQQALFFNGAFVPARMRFRHDALGQLVQASGREHAGIPAGQQTGPADAVGAPLPHPNDTAAVRLYRQEYEYDDLGNLKAMRHIANGGAWTRRYRYAHDTDPLDRRNRLTATSVPADDPDGPYSHAYTYDDYGNLTSAPHLAQLHWNWNDQLREADLGGGGTAYYRHTGGGGRSRKVVQHLGGLRTERRYLGAVEIYREWMNGTLRLERRTVHLADDAGRFAQADTLVLDTAGGDGAPLNTPVVRYQYGNHIGSATLETDAGGAVISYEEYHPYGSTAYRSARPGTDLSLKRYRFHGKERDDETGLYDYGARLYASWLGRWISADPIGTGAGPNLYAYCSNDPSGRIDPNGTDDHPPADARPVVVRETPVTGAETFAEVQALANGIPGYEWDPNVTPQNYQNYFVNGSWMVVRPSGSTGEGDGEGAEGAAGAEGATGTGSGTGTGTGAADSGAGGDTETGEGDTGEGESSSSGLGTGASGLGREGFRAGPPGPTLEVPDNFDPAKIRAYKQRIQLDRGVGMRSVRPGATGKGARTGDIRAANAGLADDFNVRGGGLRSRANQVDHMVELQHIIRRAGEFVRRIDHRYWPQSINGSQGTSARHIDDAARAAGALEDVPAGGVARTADLTHWTNSPRLRTGMRWGGGALMFAGPALTAWGASSIEDDRVRNGAYGLAATEALAGASYIGARAALARPALHSQNLARFAGVARGVAGVAGGAAQALISGYLAYEDYQRGDWTSFGFNAAAAVGGVALAIGCVVGSPVLIGIGIVTGVAAGVYGVGRMFEWW